MAVHSLEQMEEKAGEIGNLIGGACDNMGIGFALILFEFGDDGFATWISNAKRPDMIKALHEMTNRLEGDPP